MQSPLIFLTLALVLYFAGALVSIYFRKQEELAIRFSGYCGIAAGILGIIAVAPVLFGSLPTISENYGGPFSFAHLTIRLDMLSAFMVFVISLLAAVTSFYSLAYVQEYIGRGAWSMGFFMNVFIASMVMLMVVDNAFYFIVFFELMSLASYFLVIFDQDDEAVSAGLLYFFIAHAGSMLILAAFLIMFSQTKSMDFDSFRQAHFSPVLASIVFLLAFFGFGAKAGMIPLHGWLPRAHPAAPSHASAMMSGVMVKVGVFGVIKVGIDLLGASELWWGIVVLAFGAVSSVLGVLYALAEHDIKRLLAYHTVENVGIILMGVGVGMIGFAMKTPAGHLLGALGLLGALYHLLNHAVFKGLLFLGAGAIIYRLHTKDMEKMGGLAKLMPLTGLAFLIGCMAISALPPLNGFVSEWYTYQSLFSMSVDATNGFAVRLAGPIAIVMLAITGALAAMCFVKVYGVSFCGAARSEKAEHAREVPLPMTASMLVLALFCIILGIFAYKIAPSITQVANSLAADPRGALVAVEQGVLVPRANAYTALSPVMVAVMLIGMLFLPVLIFIGTQNHRLPSRHRDDPWACGYEYEGRMALSAGGFTQALRFMFSALYKVRQTLNIGPAMGRALACTIGAARKIEPFWDEKIIAPLVRAVQRVGHKAQCLQKGDFRVYCLYIVATLVILLVVVSVVARG